MKNLDPDKALEALRRLPLKQAVNALISILYHPDEAVRWRAIDCTGALLAELADNDMEGARVVMRRFMWSLNDESGGIGWGAPEAMGETLARHEALALEYGPILISYIRRDGNFLELETLQRGAVWAIGRVSRLRPGLMREAAPHLVPFLDSPDPYVRGRAAWALGILAHEPSRPALESMLEDEADLTLYDNHTLVHTRVRDLAEQALGLLDAGEGAACSV